MANETALVNGVAYHWAQVSLTLLGRVVEGVTSIVYDSTQEKTNNPGRGVKPVSRGRGKKEYSGSITLAEEEIKAIENALPVGKDLMDIKPFPIVVVFEDEAGILTTHKLLSCEFMNRGVDLNSDTTHMEKQLDLVIADINYKII